MILAGDVGGTKTRLALYTVKDGKLKRGAVEQYVSRDAPSLGALVRKFLSSTKATPTAACFGIPGPVVNGHVVTPNLPWELFENDLAQELRIPRVKLVNDLVATTAAVPALGPEDLITLHTGNPDREKNVCAVVAPGTGTGHGYLCIQNGHQEAFASEGGHIDFAPTNDVEDQLLSYLRERIGGRVSVERVLCGPGIANIYNFLKESGLEKEPPELAQRFWSENAGTVISNAGLKGEYDICVRALDMFASMLGVHCGNVALIYMATGGIYLGGGIPPKLAPKLAESRFMEGYFNKGRLSHVVRSTPVYIIKDDSAALLGAASIAAQVQPHHELPSE